MFLDLMWIIWDVKLGENVNKYIFFNAPKAKKW
jgi:hypothetical protein